MTDQTTPTDPTREYGQPGPEPRVEHPGHTQDMRTEPDHGEESYVGSGRLEGRRAVITGGDSGIGRAVAIAFAREGADVALSYLPEEADDAEVTAGHVRDAGRRVVLVPGDLREEAACTALIERAVAELGGIDVLVSNAAYQMAQEGGLLDITTEQLDRVLKTNLYAMFWLCKAAVPHLAPGSSIITTSSIQAYQPSPQLLDYATSKAGIVNFTKGLAQQLAEQGIRVNTVAPGPVWTPLIPATMTGDAVEGFGADTPLGRPAQPAELAPAYVFFASAESSYVTGERLGVAGGKPMP
ncbi:SDR family oxidoreductase [Actinotalea fermentans]|uniref:NAD(P)-dependent oxidoreductase n=1 Tax=Actinotalea fermentans TaxID=43671 RepID=A0A511YY20_9CELL|nr:SDR family oxidoreductase [Actinotalea fermentans]KGM15995.1 oxidoreductase [Actinotalea fermentans ATCC 43279 = JCM 9966 = DSM 3133]GEN80091.1 NAD(P)-dependent oxidoreductase [Actinotalea fermentans]